jgi:hypothetical protein
MGVKRQFNINEYVWVQLTAKGQQVYKEYYLNLKLPAEYMPGPKEKDADGYSKFQMWDLMAIFGESVHMVNFNTEPVFSTTILIDEDHLLLPGQDNPELKKLTDKRKINW